MGVYLPKPNKTKMSQDGEGGVLSYGLSAMQGWRLNMEDAHIAIPELKIKGFEKLGVFGVFDGHGGPAVSSWVSSKFASVFEHQLSEILNSIEENTFIPQIEQVHPNVAAVCEALQKTFLRLDVEMSFRENREVIKAIHRELEKRQSEDSTEDGADKSQQQMNFLDALLYRIHPDKTYVRLFKRDGQRFVDLGFEPGNSEDNEKFSDETSASAVESHRFHEMEDEEMLQGSGDYKLSPLEEKFENEVPFVNSDLSRSTSEKNIDTKKTEATNVFCDISFEKDTKKQQDALSKNAEITEATIASSDESKPQSPAQRSTSEKEADINDKRSEPDEKSSNHDSEKALKKTKNETISEKDLEETTTNQDTSLNQTTLEEEAHRIADTALTSIGAPTLQQQQDLKAENENKPDTENSAVINDLTSEPIDLTRIFDKCEHSVTKPDICEEEQSISSLYEEDIDNDSGLPLKSEDEEVMSWSKFQRKFTLRQINPVKPKQPEVIEEIPCEPSVEGEPDQPENCGTTAVVAVVLAATETTPPYLIVANAGDSRAVLCRNGSAIALSKDHKPVLIGERRRIRLAGGEVVNGRVDGNLNLSRALGDLYYKNNPLINPQEQKIIAFPDVRYVELQPEDEFVILACDGIWDCLSNQKAVQFVKENIPEQNSFCSDKPGKLSEICEKMCDNCLSANPISSEGGIGCDNMTVMIIHLNKERPISNSTQTGVEETNMDSVLKFYGDYNPDDFVEWITLSFDDTCF